MHVTSMLPKKEVYVQSLLKWGVGSLQITYKHWTDGLADAPWFILGENANNHWSGKHAGPRLSIGILHKPGKEEL